MPEITVAVVQMHPELGKVEDNLLAMGKFIDKICTEKNVDLVVFPELATTGYELGLRFTDVAERPTGHVVNTLAQRAADHNTHIIFGLVTKEKVESTIFNAAILLGPDGEMLGEYRKLHLPGEERLAFRPGYRLPVFETTLGQVGILLGWDLAFPEAARSMALDGAEILVLPTNFPPGQQNSPGASSSGLQPPAHSSPNLRLCSPTNRAATSTQSPAANSSIS